MNEHVSDLQWDRLLADEPTPDHGTAAYAHAKACTVCAARLRELTAERDSFQMRPIQISLPRARPRRWRWAAPLVPLLAAAAVLIALRARPRESGERTKGAGPVLLLAAGEPGALAPVATGDAVRSGSYLQAMYTTARDGFGAVLSRDGAGSIMAYVPAAGDTMVPLPAGHERLFPQSTLMDDVGGDERILIVWCETAHSVAPLLADLRARRPIRLPADCAARDLVLDKLPREP